MTALEPSAGSGVIATAAAHGEVVDRIERDPGYVGVLADARVA
ncbi:hypothetical protein ACFU99_24935 [Streptomyces sp. NPDC057654]